MKAKIQKIMMVLVVMFFFRFRNAGKRKCHKHCGSAE